MSDVLDWRPCAYCGSFATTKDHLESRTWTGHQKQGYRGPWVWSCQECNSILGDKRIPHLEDRKLYVAARLMEMYEVDAMRPHPDLDGLEGNLLRYVEAQVARQATIRERLECATGKPLPPTGTFKSC